MAHAVEHGQDRCVGPDRQRELIHRPVERVGFHAEQDEIEGLANGFRRDGSGRHREIAMWAFNLQAGSRELRGAAGAYHEGDVTACTDKAGAEIAAQRAGTDHQNTHAPSPGRRSFLGRSGITGHRQAPATSHALSGGTVVPPSPSASCIITVSSQRPNLRPTFGCVPIISNPHRLCRPIDPALAESPMTATICR